MDFRIYSFEQQFCAAGNIVRKSGRKETKNVFEENPKWPHTRL